MSKGNRKRKAEIKKKVNRKKGGMFAAKSSIALCMTCIGSQLPAGHVGHCAGAIWMPKKPRNEQRSVEDEPTNRARESKKRVLIQGSEDREQGVRHRRHTNATNTSASVDTSYGESK